MELLHQLVSLNPMAFNQLISFSCRTGDREAVQLASKLMTCSMAPGPANSHILATPHWLHYKAHISALISCIKANTKLLPATVTAAKVAACLTTRQRQLRVAGPARGEPGGTVGGVGCGGDGQAGNLVATGVAAWGVDISGSVESGNGASHGKAACTGLSKLSGFGGGVADGSWLGG